MDIIETLSKLKSKIEEARSSYERAKGRMEMADRALSEAGFTSAEELSKAIKDYETRINDMRSELEMRTNEFISKYENLLK